MLNVNNLTGFGNGSGTGDLVLTYSTSVMRNGSSAGTFTLPSCSEGDLIIACVGGYVNTGANYLPPSAAYGTGFTSLSSYIYSVDVGGRVSNWDHWGICNSYKIASASDSGASTTGFFGPYQESAAFYVYSPSKAITSVTLQDSESGTGAQSKTTDASASSEATIAVAGAIATYNDPALAISGPTADSSLDGADGISQTDSIAVLQTPTATDAVFTTSSNNRAMTSLYLEIT